MALLTLEEFADACGIATNYLSVMIARGKVNAIATGIATGRRGDDKKKIDDKDAKNAAYLAKMSIKAARKDKGAKDADITEGHRESVVESINDDGIAEEEKPLPGKKKERPTKHGGNNAGNAFLRKEALEIEKLEQEVRIKTIEADKKQGKLVPFDPVKILFLHHSRSITTTLRSGLDQWIDGIVIKHRLPKEDAAKMRKDSVNMINAAMADANTISKKGLENIVNEYSEVKMS